MKRFLGFLFILMGIAQLSWIAYNLFVEMQPEAKDLSPIIPFLFAIGLLYVGQKWAREP